MSKTENLEGQVANNCEALQPVIDSAAIGIKMGTKEQWSCPNCPVKVITRKRNIMPGPGIKLIGSRNCAEIPSFDEKLA